MSGTRAADIIIVFLYIKKKKSITTTQMFHKTRTAFQYFIIIITEYILHFLVLALPLII